MAKMSLVLLPLVLIASACGAGDGSTPSATAADPTPFVATDAEPSEADGDGDRVGSNTEPAGENGTAASDAAGAAGAGATTTGSGTLDGEARNAPGSEVGGHEESCGFGTAGDPVAVEVLQVQRSPRDPTIASALHGPHQDFPDPLIDPAEILSGGPPPDGIPPIEDPKFQTASSVDWLVCNEPVLSLSVQGDVRAYPLQIMTWHEIVNDTVGGVGVTVSFCPLCNSALVYEREIDGQILDFGTSGGLYNSSLVMYDRQTESLWTHFNGTAVVGTLTGTELELLPVQTMSWASFRSQHPDGIVLTRETGHDRRYGVNPYVGYDDVNTTPFLFRGELDDRLLAKERVVSIGQRGDSVAVVLSHLVEQGAVSVEVDGRALTVWHQPGMSSALDTSLIVDGKDIGTVAVYVADVEGRPLTFRSGEAPGGFVDIETGSSWNIGGIATAGDLTGSKLARVDHIDTFWFAIAAFEPDTRIIGR